MNPQSKAENALIRILCSDDPDHRVPNGGGVLVEARYALTCFHVVRDVMAGDRVWFDFSHIEGSPVFEAVVTKRDEAADLALLEMIQGTELPGEASPARFMPAEEDGFEKAAYICGFPEGIEGGDWVYGRLIGESGGLIQMDRELTSKAVKPGFSGVPVWVEKKRRAAGLVVERFLGEGERSAYVIPVRALVKVFPGLEVERMTEDSQKSMSDNDGDSSMEIRKNVKDSALIQGHHNQVHQTINNYYGVPGVEEIGDATQEPPKSRVVPPVPDAKIKNCHRPGGAIEAKSRFYVWRDTDEEAMREVLQARGMAILRGPRESGKTSLIFALLHRLREEASPVQAAAIDFQDFDSSDFESPDALWKAVVLQIAEDLDIETWTLENWDSRSSRVRNVTVFMEKFVFSSDDRPLLVCMDEVESLLTSLAGQDFLSNVRAFWNKGARKATWKNVRWLLSASTEPSFFIQDKFQSPFNVGQKVALQPFRRDEAERLAQAHGLAFSTSLMDEIMTYLGGRPFTTHLLFYEMAQRPPEDWAGFLDVGSAGNGLFREHLDRYLEKFQEEPDLASAMKQVVAGKGCHDVRMKDRLVSAGLARVENDGHCVCACDLYRDFFASEL